MKHVVVVGVGALGSHVVQFLRAVPDISIHVIDFDRVERKNTLSQFHGSSHVGRNKAQALAQAMQFFWKVKLDPVPHKLTEDNAGTLLLKRDLVIDCLDNAASRLVVQENVRARKIPCLHGALAADGAYGRVIWDESFEIDSEAGAGAATCEGGEHLPFIAITAGFLARAAQEFLADGVRRGYAISPGGVHRV
jgi:molybdopterin/thiamine biosynthesis adenylyltransferase